MIDRPAALVPDAAVLEVQADDAVGRGTEKLEPALTRFAIDVRGRRALDVGASTGGFTQVLLRAGAREVVAVDVGRGQLAEPLARDPRVTSLEGRDIRTVEPGELGPSFDVIVCDVSFISLTQVLPTLAGLAVVEAPIVVLVKPQFECGRSALDRHGVVRSPQHRAAAVVSVAEEGWRSGLRPVAMMPCPVTGAAGNQEYLLRLDVGTGRSGSTGSLASMSDLHDAVLQDGTWEPPQERPLKGEAP